MKNKKLQLNKETIARLNDNEANQIKGGAAAHTNLYVCGPGPNTLDLGCPNPNPSPQPNPEPKPVPQPDPTYTWNTEFTRCKP